MLAVCGRRDPPSRRLFEWFSWRAPLIERPPIAAKRGPHNRNPLPCPAPPSRTDVGRVVAALEASGLRKSTLVMFASDNGAHNEGGHDHNFFNSSGTEALHSAPRSALQRRGYTPPKALHTSSPQNGSRTGPLRGFKRSLYEGGIRSAVSVSWPGVVPANVSSDAPFAFWDVLPTVARFAGAESAVPQGLDGVPVGDLWLGQPPAVAHPPFYFEFCTVHTNDVSVCGTRAPFVCARCVCRSECACALPRRTVRLW